MQKRFLALAAIAVVATSAPGLASNNTSQVASYEALVALPADERSLAWNRMDAKEQQAVVSTHFNRWLAANRHRLSVDQIALVEQVRDSFFVDGHGGHILDRDLADRMRCGLWRSDLHALNFLQDQKSTSFVRDLDDWFFECVYTKMIDAVF